MYTQNGILNMLDRNRRIKRGPQRLQATKRQYDIILTAEERVYDQVRLSHTWHNAAAICRSSRLCSFITSTPPANAGLGFAASEKAPPGDLLEFPS